MITHIQQKIPNNVLYCVMCGKFTPDQRQLARERAKVNTEEFLKLYDWMRKNNFKFAQEPDEPKCPEPFIVEDKPTKQNTNDPLNPVIEKKCEFKYYFPSNSEPTKQGGTYDDEVAFATALLKIL